MYVLLLKIKKVKDIKKDVKKERSRENQILLKRIILFRLFCAYELKNL